MPGQIPLLMLIIHVPGGEDRSIAIKEWRTVIGRSSKTDLKIVSKQVSKIHAAIEIQDGVPYIRDLNSRNGVELNGALIREPHRLRPGDVALIGDARITVEPSSLLFRPREAQEALRKLLEQEAALRHQQASEQHAERRPRASLTVNESFVPTRQVARLVGRPVGNAAGEQPVLRVLRLASGQGPYDVARIEAFLMELNDGELVWIKPNVNVEVARLDHFPPATAVWIDEPEDFGSANQAMIIARATHYLPPFVEIEGAVHCGQTPDGRGIFSENGPDAVLVIAAAVP